MVDTEKMWHEARRQEKDIRHRMVDSRRRAERRKKFYDSVKKDPSEFMQVALRIVLSGKSAG